ncbi:hypothetical protein WG66_003803 [Moniliophthora roreri]|nr:hypothetical protein WG66_003803 [Moniliophthora roreri]
MDCPPINVHNRDLPELPPRSALERLFREEPGVKGCGWFHRYQEDPLHVLGNVLRVACSLIFAPFMVFSEVGEAVGYVVYNLAHAGWRAELADRFEAVLANPPKDDDDDRVKNLHTLKPSSVCRSASAFSSASSLPHTDTEVYEKTNFEPRWMLKVSIREGRYGSHEQIEWTEDYHKEKYTALSYNMDAAKVLFNEAGGRPRDPIPPGSKAKFSLWDRREISKQLLVEYCSAIRDQPEPPDREEFIWLDESCLSRETHTEAQQDEQAERKKVKFERNEELGCLADIFRGARTVVPFCDVVDCNHWSLECSWGNRLFTLGEILHANEVRRMTRKTVRDEHGRQTKPRSHLYTRQSARSFCERMVHRAAIANKWHLHMILRQSNNSGSDTWQMAIHALIVEAIRRDEKSGFCNHELLGKGLNELLPRRARLHHLKGKNGWADLAWLLELNQGFYNQAALAAVCRLPDIPEAGSGWLGPPIEPKAGNERLEPLVTAFTVGGTGKTVAPLNIVGAQTIGLHPFVARDARVLYRNPHARQQKTISIVLFVICWIIAILMITSGRRNGLSGAGTAILWISSAAFNLVRLLVGTMYLEHNGWVFLSETKWNDGGEGDAAWGSDPEKVLRRLDASLDLFEWGDRQMVPRWEPDRDKDGAKDVRDSDNWHRYMRGQLVDLRTGIRVRVVVAQKPNAMVALAIHGSGITYMLLNRPDNVYEIAAKVGMVNLPPFTFMFTEKCGSIRVGPVNCVATIGKRSETRTWHNRDILRRMLSVNRLLRVL